VTAAATTSSAHDERREATLAPGGPVLTKMAHELARTIRLNATIDWNVRESVKAKLRSLVRRLLRKYKYPPDAQEKATEILRASLLDRRSRTGCKLDLWSFVTFAPLPTKLPRQ
jgi:hypothetical protein